METACASIAWSSGARLIRDWGSTRQRILGHSDPRLTAAAYVAFDVEDLRDAVEGMPVIGEGAVREKGVR